MALVSFSGLASGIDSSALIKSLLDQERAGRVKPLEEKITTLQDTNKSLSELSNLLKSLQTAAGKFRALNGGSLAKQIVSTDETVLTGSATNSATNGTYDLTITQRATNATFSFDDRLLSSSAVINSSINDSAPEADRTVSFSIGDGDAEETVDVVLTSTTTASQFVTAFNAASEKALASVVNVGTSASPSYAIVIHSTEEGETDGLITLNSVGSELAAGSGALQDNTLSQAQNAIFSIGGIADDITRSSNTVTDVIPGVSFTLQSEGSAKITVTDDTSATLSTIQDFVDAFNEVVKFIGQNDLITQEQDGSDIKNIFGPLADTSLDENVLSALREAVAGASGLGGTINMLADLGITTERDGTLKFDSEIFEEAMASDPEGVRAVTESLGETLSAVDGTIAQFVSFNGLFDGATQANNDLITSLQKRISATEADLTKREESLTARFSRLESLIGQLNSQQSALTSILPR